MKLPNDFILDIDIEVNDDNRDNVKGILTSHGILDVDWYFVHKEWYVRGMEIIGTASTISLFIDLSALPVIKFSSLM